MRIGGQLEAAHLLHIIRRLMYLHHFSVNLNTSVRMRPGTWSDKEGNRSGQMRMRVLKVEDSEVARAGISRTVREFVTFERHVLYVLYRKEESRADTRRTFIERKCQGRKGRHPMGDARVAA